MEEQLVERVVRCKPEECAHFVEGLCYAEREIPLMEVKFGRECVYGIKGFFLVKEGEDVIRKE